MQLTSYMITERLLSMSKKYEDRMKRFDDVEISNQDAVKQILEELPSERASALVVALMDLSELAPTDSHDMKKAVAQVENYFELLKKIRANLHTALDEES